MISLWPLGGKVAQACALGRTLRRKRERFLLQNIGDSAKEASSKLALNAFSFYFGSRRNVNAISFILRIHHNSIRVNRYMNCC